MPVQRMSNAAWSVLILILAMIPILALAIMDRLLGL